MSILAFPWRHRLTAVVRGLALILLVVALLFGAFSWIVWPTYRKPPEPDFPAPKTAVEATLQDLRYLRTTAAYDRSFSDAARAEFDRRVKSLERRAGELDRADLELGVAWAVAAADNGHTNGRTATRGRNLDSIPLRFAWFGYDLRVMKVRPGYEAWLGAQVVAEEGRPIADVTAALQKYYGGKANAAAQNAINIMESPTAMRAAGLSTDASGLTFTLKRPGAAPETLRVPAESEPVVAGEKDAKPIRDLSPRRSEADRAAWRHVADGRPLPLYLRNPDANYWRARTADGVEFIQLNSMRDAGPVGVRAFLSQALDEIRARPPRAVVVDLRANGGGDYMGAADFTKALPGGLADGRPIYVLTGPVTFSAAIVTLARLKMYGGSRVRQVGEDVGDRAVYWGEGEKVTLPNSKAVYRYATAMHRHDRNCRLSEIRACFWMDYFNPSVAKSLSPERPVTPGFAAYIAGRDPVMDAVMAELQPAGSGGAHAR